MMRRSIGPWFGVLVLCIGPVSVARAQAHIRLAEVLPALADTELGQFELGTAPPPGSSRIVRRSEVVSALREAGHDVRGLAIPRATRVERRARVLNRDELAALVSDPIANALDPCQVQSTALPARTSLPDGPVSPRVQVPNVRRTGHVNAIVVLDASGRETRVPIRVEVLCPPPAVQPGHRVRIVVQVRNVVASAPGEARQAARIGEDVRVTNLLTRRTILGRVEDSETVRLLR